MKTRSKNFLKLITAALSLALFASSCQKDDNDAPGITPVTGVQLSANTKFGSVLTDNTGRSLYMFAVDANGSAGCTGGCLTVWPAFYKENPSIGTGLNATDFGMITRTDGAKQTTYKGWPLYYYAPDAVAGDTKGDGVEGVWFIAKNDYTVFLGNQQLVGHDGLQYTSAGVAGVEKTSFLVDAGGRTLYLFSRDTHNTNTFTRADLSNDAVWPMFQVTGVGSVPSIMDKTQFSTITVAGKTQLVFKGHPLYYFGQDAATRGYTKGVSFPTPGAAVWKILNNSTAVL